MYLPQNIYMMEWRSNLPDVCIFSQQIKTMPPKLKSTMSQKAVTAAFWGFKAFTTMGVSECYPFNPFKIAVPFWEQNSWDDA